MMWLWKWIKWRLWGRRKFQRLLREVYTPMVEEAIYRQPMQEFCRDSFLDERSPWSPFNKRIWTGKMTDKTP